MNYLFKRMLVASACISLSLSANSQYTSSDATAEKFSRDIEFLLGDDPIGKMCGTTESRKKCSYVESSISAHKKQFLIEHPVTSVKAHVIPYVFHATGVSNISSSTYHAIVSIEYLPTRHCIPVEKAVLELKRKNIQLSTDTSFLPHDIFLSPAGELEPIEYLRDATENYISQPIQSTPSARRCVALELKARGACVIVISTISTEQKCL